MSGMPLAEEPSLSLALCIDEILSTSVKASQAEIFSFAENFLRKQAMEEIWDKAKEVAKQAIAGLFKTGWRQFSQQLAY
ncbi:MAG TPA: hypothetical protein PK085_03360, partial [bacterium]|nr:hypothetical protein [bacterium]